MSADLLARTYDGVTALLRTLDEADLTRPTRCSGWVVVDVLAHLLGDAQRCLVACATPTDDQPDVDAVRYWTAWSAATDPLQTARQLRWQRIQASAYHGPQGLLAQWTQTAEAAARALAARRPDERLRTQGHVLAADDLGRTLVVEAAVHHLDCLLHLADRPRPPQEAVAVAAQTMSGLAGTRLPATDEWVLKGAGRQPLVTADRSFLGPAADRFPLLR